MYSNFGGKIVNSQFGFIVRHPQRILIQIVWYITLIISSRQTSKRAPYVRKYKTYGFT